MLYSVYYVAAKIYLIYFSQEIFPTQFHILSAMLAIKTEKSKKIFWGNVSILKCLFSYLYLINAVYFYAKWSISLTLLKEEVYMFWWKFMHNFQTDVPISIILFERAQISWWFRGNFIRIYEQNGWIWVLPRFNLIRNTPMVRKCGYNFYVRSNMYHFIKP